MQTDKKTLNTKMMMQEMKEVREQRRAADTAVKAVSVKTPFVFPLSPDLTFNCQDGWAPAPPSLLPSHELDHILTAISPCDWGASSAMSPQCRKQCSILSKHHFLLRQS